MVVFGLYFLLLLLCRFNSLSLLPLPPISYPSLSHPLSLPQDSPFPDGNPDSLSPSSTAEPKGTSAPAANQQEDVFVIDELPPEEQLDVEETDKTKQEQGASHRHSPPRTTSITEEEALGEFSSPSLSFPLSPPSLPPCSTLWFTMGEERVTMSLVCVSAVHWTVSIKGSLPTHSLPQYLLETTML